MWIKCVSSVSTNIFFRTSIRQGSRSLTNVSYLHNPGSEPLTYATIGQAVENSAHRYPGRVAVRSVYEDRTLTYEQLLVEADALGCALRSQGLEKGDRVGIWSHNNAAWIVAMVATARVGLISLEEDIKNYEEWILGAKPKLKLNATPKNIPEITGKIRKQALLKTRGVSSYTIREYCYYCNYKQS